MAPADRPRATDTTSQPLADYFWIAGVDSQQLLDAYKPHRWSYEGNESLGLGSDHSTEQTIQEDVVAELQESVPPVQPPRTNARGHARKDSYQRLSDLSGEARNSILALENGQSAGSGTGTRSNRSSITIKAVSSPTTNGHKASNRMSTMISDVDFENAMQKFTNDRESFFLDLNFNNNNNNNNNNNSTNNNNNAKTRPRTSRSRPRTQKIVPTDMEPLPNGPSRHLGSVRRHLSFKDLSSSKRQPSMAHRTSTRTTKRVSSYNSVVPNPEALRSSPDQHPLRRKFEPVLLDKYPRSSMVEEMSTRDPMPEYLPMFAFPNDISIVSSDTRPRSTWHEFCMTAGDNTKIPAVCIIVYIPLKRETADELEQRCEEWRRANMTEAEREMAASLAERLALERARLSQLLAKLPSVEGDAREDLEEEISTVEERIAVMSDMLRPLRHGAASRIDGLTDDDSTGLWIPRAYGILGRDPCLSAFWRQWLRAVAVPMHDGSILRVPASSPRVGMWQPLERYVHVMCSMASRPLNSKTQLDLSIRELHIYAKKEASNELPGSRTTDLWPLFRTLTIPNIIVLLEYVLAESRVILLSSHNSMLQLASRAILELIWPFKWAGVYIPVLPSRLVQALEAPCPYICGIDRSYEKWDLPEDDFVLVDLDKNELQSTAHPPALPKQIRRKLMSLLHLAAPHHHSFGVSPGPPAYAIETYPYNSFAADYPSVFTGIAQSTNLNKLVSLSSTMFGPPAAADTIRRAPILNAFLANGPMRGKSTERPRTASTAGRQASSQPDSTSPVTSNFPVPPLTPTSRSDSGYALQTSLREKRSGHFDSHSKRNPSMSGLSTQFSSMGARRKGSLPFNNSVSTSSPTSRHNASPSTTSISPADYYPPHQQHQQFTPTSTYAPSTYAQSTLAASTIMPHMHVQPPPVSNSATTQWVEGHMLLRRPTSDGPSTCVLCDEKAEPGTYFRCQGCGFVVHASAHNAAAGTGTTTGYSCGSQITVPCPSAFYPDQIRASFVRMFAALLYTYRKYIISLPDTPASTNGTSSRQTQRGGRTNGRNHGVVAKFELQGFIRSLEREHGEYINMLGSTQGFMEFVAEREVHKDTLKDEDRMRIQLFDAVILAKAKRGGKARWGMGLRQPSMPSLGPKMSSSSLLSSASGRGVFGSRSVSGTANGGNDSAAADVDVLNDTSTHQWRPIAAPGSSVERPEISPQVARGRDYRQIISRVPASLEDGLFPGGNTRLSSISTTSSRTAEPGRMGVGSHSRIPSLPKLDPSKFGEWSMKLGAEMPKGLAIQSTTPGAPSAANTTDRIPDTSAAPAETSWSYSNTPASTWGRSGPQRLPSLTSTTEPPTIHAEDSSNHRREKSSGGAIAPASSRTPLPTDSPTTPTTPKKATSAGIGRTKNKPPPLRSPVASDRERAGKPPVSPAAAKGMNGLGMHSPRPERGLSGRLG